MILYNTLHDTFLDFVVWVSQKQSTVIDAKKKKAAFNLSDSSKQHSREHWSPQSKALLGKFGTAMHSRYALFRKQYMSRLMQIQAVEITAGRSMRYRVILSLAILHRLILKFDLFLWKLSKKRCHRFFYSVPTISGDETKSGYVEKHLFLYLSKYFGRLTFEL